MTIDRQLEEILELLDRLQKLAEELRQHLEGKKAAVRYYGQEDKLEK